MNNHKNIVIKLTNNFIINLTNIITGLSHAINNKCNFYINNINNIDNSLFNKFEKKQSDDSINKYDEIDFSIPFKNYFNFNKKKDLCTLFNHKKEILCIYISLNNEIDEKYYIKCLSLLNYNDMNIIVFIKDSSRLQNINFLINLNYHIDTNKDENSLILLSAGNYIITNNSKFSFWGCIFSESSSKIFIPNNYLYSNIINTYLLNNFTFINNIFDYDYLCNKTLVIDYNNYTLINKVIYKINNNHNKLYLDYNLVKEYKYSSSDLTKTKIKTYIINLEHRPDRLKHSLNECLKINLNNIEIYNVTHPNIIIINPNKAWKKNLKYLINASGCKLSHLEILRKSININEEYILILEDDIVFEENAMEYLNLALLSLKDINWDILFLATNLDKKNDAFKINNNLLKIHHGMTTTAQLFKKSNIPKIISIIEASDVEIDNTYNILNNKYCVYPMCVYQIESYSDINNINVNYGNFHKKFNY